MLNYDTLLSSYDDKLTLMQWLKKVEAALAGAALASVSIEQPTETTAVLTFHFADGTALSSPSLILPKGEQGEQGKQGEQGEQGVSVKSAYIKDGNLHLVLTNGDDLGAGNLFNGDIALSGNLSAVDVNAASATIRNVDAESITASDITLSGNITAAGVKTPILTSDEPEITAEKPVVEVMNGYGFERGYAGTAFDINVTYAGAVKNGNKLTLSLAFTIKRKSDDISTEDWKGIVGKFAIPSSVYDRLVGGASGLLDVKQAISLFPDLDVNPFPLFMGSRKAEGEVQILLLIKSVTDTLGLNTTYYSRYEVTFLLSDNMAA